jgi:hypothetical protein
MSLLARIESFRFQDIRHDLCRATSQSTMPVDLNLDVILQVFEMPLKNPASISATALRHNPRKQVT